MNRIFGLVLFLAVAALGFAQETSLVPFETIRFASSFAAELNFQAKIGVDGILQLPKKHRCVIAGMKWPDASAELRFRLQSLGFDVRGLTIERLGLASSSVFFAGAVRNPGSALWTKGLRLGEVILYCQPTVRADLDAITITDSRGSKTTHRYEGVASGSHGDTVFLKPGDQVFFPQLEQANEVTVAGEVAFPGRIDFRRGMTLTAVIGLAGGVTGNGDASKIEVSRGGKLAQIVNLLLADEVSLQRGDRIRVPTKAFPAYVSVVGAVTKEGQIGYKDGMRLTDALSLASGLRPDALRTEIIVSRRIDGTMQQIKCNLDRIARREQANLILMPGDIVEVKIKPSEDSHL